MSWVYQPRFFFLNFMNHKKNRLFFFLFQNESRHRISSFSGTIVWSCGIWHPALFRRNFFWNSMYVVFLPFFFYSRMNLSTVIILFLAALLSDHVANGTLTKGLMEWSSSFYPIQEKKSSKKGWNIFQCRRLCYEWQSTPPRIDLLCM